MARDHPSDRRVPNPLRRAGHRLTPAELSDVAAFAADRPATPLHDARELAARLGLARLLVKDESSRWGLDAFKITGVSYALARWLASPPGRARRVTRLVTASAGNHGRAVARAARERGLACRVFLPSDALASRVEGIRAEGAEAVSLAGSYEDALRAARADASDPDALLISDTSHRADADADAGPALDLPSLIMRGYTRVFAEAAAVWPAPPDVIVVQGGVGGLVGAAAGWMGARLPSARLVAAEPEGSACLMASALAGGPVTLPATRPTSMVCLRCAEPSAAAWPHVAAGVDAFVTITDAETASAVAALAGAGIATGASGAAGFAALTAIAPAFAGRIAMIVVTEGI